MKLSELKNKIRLPRRKTEAPEAILRSKKNKKHTTGKAETPQEAAQHLLKVISKLILRISLTVAVVVAVLNLVICVAVIHDTNCFPNVKDGDLVIAYRLTGVYTGDLVLYEADGKIKAGRICGVAGDVVDIPKDDIYYTINGTIPYETIYTDTKRAEKSAVQYPYEIPEGTYFVLNDDRSNTADSREFGVIPVENIAGKVVLTIRRRGF